MRILVINRVDDSACADAMKLIPGAKVQIVNEESHDACAEAFNEFRPHIIIVSDSADPRGVGSIEREYSGMRIWYPTSMLMREPPYSFFTNSKRGVGCIFPGITDLNELAIRVVEESIPEVFIFITDPDKIWQETLKKDFSEIPGVIVSAHGGIVHVGEAIRFFVPDIVVMNWMDALPPNFIRRYVKDSFGLKIAVLSSISERDIIAKGPQVDFVLCKASPVGALTLMVKHWTEMCQLDKRRELREGLLRNQMQVNRSS